MCRNIRPLFNYEPPATKEEIHDAALQFIRKISGFHDPSELNKMAFEKAVKAIEVEIQQLLDSLTTKAEPKNRAIETEKARERSRLRFG